MAHENDNVLPKVLLAIEQGKQWRVSEDKDGIWRFKGRIIVTDVGTLRQDILKEAHKSGFSIHLGSTKMYLSESKDRTPETFWEVTTLGDTLVEVRQYFYGFSYRTT